MDAKPLLVVLTVALGALVPVQAAANAKMGKLCQSVIHASVINCVVGVAWTVLLAAALAPRPPKLADVASAPWWVWTAGVIGGTFVVAAAALSLQIGTVMFTAAILAGQMTAAVVVDHYGLLGLNVHAITPGRVLGVVLLIAGVVLIRRY